MRGSWLPYLLAAAVAVVASPLRGQEPVEEILSYDVRIEVADGGVMRVTEAIDVRALGEEIRRGIYRDFPTRFPSQGGAGRVVAPFRVFSVTRDGEAEPYALEQIMGAGRRGGIRVRIGDPDVFLTRGEHRYEIAYETERWFHFDPAGDGLYWNVTGNGWSFPIRSASAVISLPRPVAPDDVALEAWTGPDGSEAQDATWAWDEAAGGPVFRTTRPLASSEGLTIRVDVPKGIVQPPSPEQEAAWSHLDWGGYLEALPVVGLLLALYLFMWIRVGRDPPSRPVVVEYEPPQEFSPAALGFLRKRGYEPAQLNAAFVDLAVKGAVTIEKDGRKWRILPTGVTPKGLARDERRLYDKLIAGHGSLTLSGAPNARLRKAVKEFKNGLRRRIEGHYFVTNRRWFFGGLAASLAGFALLGWRARFSVSPEIWFFGFWLAFWTIGVVTLLVRAGRTWAQALSGDALAWVGAIFLTLFSLPFVAAEVIVGGMLFQGAPGHLTTAAVLIGCTNVAFYHLLERPTLKGRGVLDRLEGFRRYLGAAEGDVYDRLQSPDRGLELFEKLLPYAIALGVGNRWAERFERSLTPAERERSGSGALGWYSGGHGGADLAGMTSALGHSFSSSLSAASASPSSSGGSGGGSSGGGGGGGGGGGW